MQQASVDNVNTPFPLADILASWVLQAGYPLITLRRTDSNTITVSQEIFLIDSNDEPGDFENPEAEKFKYVKHFLLNGEDRYNV